MARPKTMPPATQPPAVTPTPHIRSVDVLRGITILWVTLFHFHADTRGVAGAEAWPGPCLSALQAGDVGEALSHAAAALVGAPAFRVDLFLFVSGLVLMLSYPTSASDFLRRRLRAVLPSYWLGTLLTLGVFAALAGIRAAVSGAGFSAQLHDGALLGRVPYRFEDLDVLRSLTVVGRFQDQRAMQVLAPSLWYVLLVIQAYCVFPVLRACLSRFGPWRFLAAVVSLSFVGRWIVLNGGGLPGFAPTSAVVYLLPLRLTPLAAGMVASQWAEALRVVPGRRISLGLLVPSLVLILGAVWAADEANSPGTLHGLVGPIATLLPALPGLWIVTTAVLSVPRLGAWVAWAGRHAIAILVVQDPLRFVVGTVMSLGGRLGPYTWWLAPVYLVAVVLLARVWHPLPSRLADWIWPPAGTEARGLGSGREAAHPGPTDVG